LPLTILIEKLPLIIPEGESRRVRERSEQARRIAPTEASGRCSIFLFAVRRRVSPREGKSRSSPEGN